MVRKPSQPRKPRKLTHTQAPPPASESVDQDSVPTAELASAGPIELAGEDLAIFDTGSMPSIRNISGQTSASGSGESFDDNAAYNVDADGSYVSVRSSSRRSWTRRAPAEERDDISVRRAEKRAERRRFLSVRIGALVALVAVALGVGYAVFFSPLFSLEASKIEVRAPEQTTVAEEDIISVLTPSVGTSLFRLSPAKLAAKVEETVPRTGDVTVDRVLPHGLRVSFADKPPIACVTSGQACTPIDEEGREVQATAEERQNLLKLVYDGEREEAGGYALDIIAILEALPSELAEKAVQAEVAAEGEITLVFANGQIIRWGLPGDTDLKVEVLSVVMTEPAGLYDVSEPRSPVAGPSPAPPKPSDTPDEEATS